MNTRLLEIMKQNEIERIDLHDEGTLVFKQHKVKKNLTKKAIITLLETYFVEDPGIAHEIDKFLCENTQTNMKDVIVRNKK
jgi:Family of unknown function (DUF5760)